MAEENEIELSLGLSLNGKFGFDPNSKNSHTNLRRSFSISNVEKTGGFEFGFGSGCTWVGNGGLGRTCSLPVEADEELRKRKRVRVEKMGNGSGLDWDGQSQGEGSGSGSGSEFDSRSNIRSFSGMNTTMEAKSPQSVQSLDQNEPKSHPKKLQNDLYRSFSGSGEMLKNMLANMPCVSTKGDGPNGKQIEGFLYRYKKGEEVRIVCVCHGSFLTPAEFVKHAGGKNVEHPLRRIVVNSSSFL